jgi:hypothetical protein
MIPEMVVVIAVATNKATCKSHWRKVGLEPVRASIPIVSGNDAICSVSSDTNDSGIHW